jgi:hypothetical protein
MITRILSIVFFIVSLGLGYYLFHIVKSDLDEQKKIERVEKNVIEKLKLIRDTEMAFQKIYGRYTQNWDSLVSFLDSGTIYITNRREEIIAKAYGDEDVIVHIDTVGTVPAKQYVFTATNLITASDSGNLVSVNVKVGDEVTIGYLIYTMQTSEKLLKYKSQYNGTVTLVEHRAGDKVNKGTTIVEILNNKYPTITDISRLPIIPGSGKKFAIYANKVLKSGVPVDVFEVKDSDPINPARRANHNENALRVGSREEVTTSGNWE